MDKINAIPYERVEEKMKRKDVFQVHRTGRVVNHGLGCLILSLSLARNRNLLGD
jgi:hypothetical protein